VVCDEAVQGVLAMCPVIVVHSGIIGIHDIIDLLGIVLEVVKVVDACVGKDLVRLYQCCKAFGAGGRIIHIVVSARTVEDNTLVDGVEPYGICVVHVGVEAVAQACEEERLGEERDVLVFAQQFGEVGAGGLNHAVQCVNHAVLHGVVTKDELGSHVDIVHHIATTSGIAVTGEGEEAVVHVGCRDVTVAEVGGEVGSRDDVVPRNRVTFLLCQLRHAVLAMLVEVVVDGVVGRSQTGVGAIGGHHPEQSGALQDFYEIAIDLWPVREIVADHLTREGVVVLFRGFVGASDEGRRKEEKRKQIDSIFLESHKARDLEVLLGIIGLVSRILLQSGILLEFCAVVGPIEDVLRSQLDADGAGILLELGQHFVDHSAVVAFAT